MGELQLLQMWFEVGELQELDGDVEFWESTIFKGRLSTNQ